MRRGSLGFVSPAKLGRKGRGKNMDIIKIGDRIHVYKSRLGSDTGILKSVDGFSCGGFFGTYLSDFDGKVHNFDQTVWEITKIDDKPEKIEPLDLGDPIDPPFDIETIEVKINQVIDWINNHERER